MEAIMDRGQLRSVTVTAFFALVFFLLPCSSTLQAQDSTPRVDILPLAVGNSWRYACQIEDEHLLGLSKMDDGYIDCVIVRASQSADTILWELQETATIHRKSWYIEGKLPDTNLTYKRTFKLRELLSGDHPVYPLGGSEVFRFGNDLQDTFLVNRFAIPDTTAIVYFRVLDSVGTWRFVFRGGEGLEFMGRTKQDLHAFEKYRSSFRLLSQTLVAVNSPPLEQPQVFALSQNFPNPFNPSTRIKYSIGGNRERGSGLSDVFLVVYDVLGREVSVLVRERQQPGSYEVSFDGRGLASGVYFYRMTADEFVQTKKLVLIH
jgi:hypothetical protein